MDQCKATLTETHFTAKWSKMFTNCNDLMHEFSMGFITYLLFWSRHWRHQAVSAWGSQPSAENPLQSSGPGWIAWRQCDCRNKYTKKSEKVSVHETQGKSPATWCLRSRFCICCFNIKLLKDSHQNQLLCQCEESPGNFTWTQHGSSAHPSAALHQQSRWSWGWL